MPKLKTHHWAGMTCSMKNLFGTVPGAVYGWPKNPLHVHGISKLDSGSDGDYPAAFRHCRRRDGDGRGRTDHGASRALGFVAMGSDPVAVDATCARVIGLDPEKIEYLRPRRSVPRRDRHRSNRTSRRTARAIRHSIRRSSPARAPATIPLAAAPLPPDLVTLPRLSLSNSGLPVRPRRVVKSSPELILADGGNFSADGTSDRALPTCNAVIYKVLRALLAMRLTGARGPEPQESVLAPYLPATRRFVSTVNATLAVIAATQHLLTPQML